MQNSLHVQRFFVRAKAFCTYKNCWYYVQKLFFVRTAGNCLYVQLCFSYLKYFLDARPSCAPNIHRPLGVWCVRVYVSLPLPLPTSGRKPVQTHRSLHYTLRVAALHPQFFQIFLPKLFFDVERWNVGDRLKRVFPKFEAERSHPRGGNGRSKSSKFLASSKKIARKRKNRGERTTNERTYRQQL